MESLMGEGRSQPTPAPPRRGKAESGEMAIIEEVVGKIVRVIFLP
ncbi:hypothetical protein [Okeania sp. SIO2C2]|nr:hypothetical protein [Okeania sp. SIO2C2]